MAVTGKGQNTEQLIIDAAKKLFYEQGYSATTVSQITNLAGVNNGLFTYYFKTKSNLSGIITSAYRLLFRNVISKQLFELYGKYDFALAIAVEYRKDVELMTKNAKLRRFMIEQRSDATPNLHISYEEILSTQKDLVSSKRGHYYQLQRRLINPHISDVDLAIYQLCGIAVTDTLTYAYNERLLMDATPEYLADKFIEICFFLLQVPPDRIEEIKKESLEAAKQVHVRYKDYFEVCE